MNTLARYLLIVCVCVCVMSVGTEEATDANRNTSEENELNSSVLVTLEPHSETVINNEAVPLDDAAEARSLSNGYQNAYMSSAEEHAELRKRAKPLKHIFLGIYKNYKSTYLGNRTTEEYKQKLKERNDAINTRADATEEADEENTQPEEELTTQASSLDTGATLQWMLEQLSASTAQNLLSKKRRKHKRHPEQPQTTTKHIKKRIEPPAGGDDPLLSMADDEYNYNVGPGVNMSLNMENDVIKVKLNANNLREIINGHWLRDNSEEGRGKKYDMMTKVLPLFILPFLIQSAIVPFLVTKLKLLLINSILVGKLAIFLLIISAIKNSNKMMQTYEVAPSYWAGEPSRRSELAAAATSAAYNGYRVEGKPTTWIN